MQPNSIDVSEHKNLGKVLVLGATGQTGSNMVKELLRGEQARTDKVVAYGNSRLPEYSGPRAEHFEGRQAPMQELASSRQAEVRGFDAIFFHVGTQRRKAGIEGQIQLEFDHTLAVATAARNSGCRFCHLVSSAGADRNSSATYLKTKGRIEEALKALDFERLMIYRPGALLGGERQGFVHTFMGVCCGCCVPHVDVSVVAKAMRIVALNPKRGAVEIYENDEILRLADLNSD